MVPILTCGFVRSNFALAILAAIAMGAVPVESRELLTRLKAAGLRKYVRHQP